MQQETLPQERTEWGITLPGGLWLSKYAVVVFAAIIVFGFIPMIMMAITPHYHGTPLEKPYPPVPDFSLPNVDGTDFTPDQLEGQIVVYYFGFTQCPDVCPTTLYELKRTMEELGPRHAEDVSVVFISIDPDNDTPEIINAYLENFNEDFIGLYGTREQIDPVLDAFNVRVLRAADGDPLAPGISITHTNAMFAADGEGNLRIRMAHGGDPELMARDLRYLMRDFELQFWK